MIICISDSGHADNEEAMSDNDAMGPYRSQGGKFIALATPSAIKGEDCYMHIISYGSRIVPRVCRSTITAEAYQLEYCKECGDLVRGASVDMH